MTRAARPTIWKTETIRDEEATPPQTQTSTTEYLYEDGSVLGTRDENGNITNFHILTPGGELIQTERPQTQGGPKLYLYNKDDQGSTTSILGEDGSAVKVYDYDPYGNTEVLSGDGFDNEVCYTGQIYDGRTGLYYYNARFYDASAGAFTSQDTYRGEGSDPRTLNLYGYCGGDPVNLTDPTGHWWLAKAWKGLKSKVKKSKVFRGAKKIKKKAKKVYHKAKKKVQRAKRAVKKTGHKIKKKAKKIIRKAKKKLRRAKNQVVTRFRSGKKKVSEAVRNGKTKIKDAARSAVDKAKRGAAAAIKRGNDALISKRGKGMLKVASRGANTASATIDIAGNAINDRESGATWKKLFKMLISTGCLLLEAIWLV